MITVYDKILLSIIAVCIINYYVLFKPYLLSIVENVNKRNYTGRVICFALSFWTCVISILLLVIDFIWKL